MITNFKVSNDRKKVTWDNDGKLVAFEFEYPVSAHHIDYLDEVLIHSSTKEDDAKNLAIYYSNGILKARPNMPKLKHEVSGVYSVWFEQGQKQITVVLLSDEYNPYDTACSFDLETYKFLKFHPTK
jgi:hypothetical protein